MRGARVPSGVVVVTDRRQAAAPLPEVVAAAVAGGARWVLLREKDLPTPARAALAAHLREVLAPVAGQLLVAGPDPLGGDRVHLAAADPTPRTLAAAGLVGRSCHSPAELARLTTEDYITLSPVFASASKPGYGPALGTAELARLVPLAGRPVLALGGVETPDQAAACRRAGASGVAVMGAVMRAADPAATVATLRTAFAQAAFEQEVTV
ncbi:thiamine phosphate synthase [Natronosporangium hydrolyticum]|uniref:Thiamine phosphate synthase n=1 Tax=Natronosporangium hydrolyticum TaxID=2811111 RepID=A0A895YGZ8_9ACTN|nr:thiamine phosphate synthase [Natronosporangium hydrolyticum]QSB13806.1 thiamine phosphate synthase [Natronosporangium hydrolyticum]